MLQDVVDSLRGLVTSQSLVEQYLGEVCHITLRMAYLTNGAHLILMHIIIQAWASCMQSSRPHPGKIVRYQLQNILFIGLKWI